MTGLEVNTLFWEDLAVDGKIILECILGKQWEGVDWTHLAQDRDQ
jgi:hypothetical protein